MKNSKMKIMRVISRILLYILLMISIFILIYNIVYTFRIAIKKENDINFLGIRSIVIDNNMMSPDLKKYDLVFLRKYDNDSVKIDDIVAFYENGNKNTSVKVTRIVQKEKYTNETYYLTKGDNNYYFDTKKITQNELEGKVWFCIPIIGIIIKIAQSKVVTGLIFLVLMFLCLEMIRIYKRKIKRREKKRENKNQKLYN